MERVADSGLGFEWILGSLRLRSRGWFGWRMGNILRKCRIRFGVRVGFGGLRVEPEIWGEVWEEIGDSNLGVCVSDL